jgi:hypothetical protein
MSFAVAGASRITRSTAMTTIYTIGYSDRQTAALSRAPRQSRDPDARDGSSFQFTQGEDRVYRIRVALGL